jgi:hypothetical protein
VSTHPAGYRQLPIAPLTVNTARLLKVNMRAHHALLGGSTCRSVVCHRSTDSCVRRWAEQRVRRTLVRLAQLTQSVLLHVLMQLAWLSPHPSTRRHRRHRRKRAQRGEPASREGDTDDDEEEQGP